MSQLFAAPGSIRLSDAVVNSRELPELAERLNITTDEFNQIMNISLNISKVGLSVYYHFLISPVNMNNCALFYCHVLFIFYFIYFYNKRANWPLTMLYIKNTIKHNDTQ